MLAMVIDHLWQSTLTVLLAAALVVLLRRYGAQVRYWVWFAASMKFLIPFGLLAAIGSQLPWHQSGSVAVEQRWFEVAGRLLQPMTHTVSTPQRLYDRFDADGSSRIVAVPETSNRVDPGGLDLGDDPDARNDVSPELRPDEVAREGMSEAAALASESRNAAETPAVAGGGASVAEGGARREPVQRPDTAQSAVEPSPDGITAVRPGHEPGNTGVGAGTYSLLAALVVFSWVLGAVLVASIRILQWMRLHRLAHDSRPLTSGMERHGLTILVTPRSTGSPSLQPGVFGVRKPVLLIPEGLFDRLAPKQVDAILRHERLHVIRRDNLTALMHTMVEVVFWFHPLVWWIGGKLVDERERACDEAVLAAGTEPDTYSSAIIDVCEFYLPSPVRWSAGVGGGSLEGRVRSINANRARPSLGMPLKSMLVAMPVIALAVPLVAGMFSYSDAVAQQGEQAVSVGDELPRESGPEQSGEGVRGGDGLTVLTGPSWTTGVQPVDTSASNLDRFVGYYYGYPDTHAGEFAPVFAVHRDGENLVLDWSGHSVVFYPSLPHASGDTDREITSFFTADPDGLRRTLGTTTARLFIIADEAGDIWIQTRPTDRSGRHQPDTGAEIPMIPVIPVMTAVPVDASLAQMLLADINRRIVENRPMVVGREVVDEIIERLGHGDETGDSLAAEAVRAIRRDVEAARPGTLAARGELRAVELVDVMRSGRDIYDVRFEHLAFRVEVVAGVDGSVEGLRIDPACRRPATLGDTRPGYCASPIRVGFRRAAQRQLRYADGTLPDVTLLQAGFMPGMSGAMEDIADAVWGRNMNATGCGASTWDQRMRSVLSGSPRGHMVLSELVRFAYDLKAYELIWPDDLADPGIQLSVPGHPSSYHAGGDDTFDREQCRAFIRESLAHEIGLRTSIRSDTLPVWQLTPIAEGPRLRVASPDQPLVGFQPAGVYGLPYRIDGRRVDMGSVAGFLSMPSVGPVIDRTGLAGRYDFSVTWAPVSDEVDDRQAQQFASFIAGMEEDIGLTLVAAEQTLERIVVESFQEGLIEIPDEVRQSGQSALTSLARQLSELQLRQESDVD